MGPALQRVIDELLAAYEARDTEGILFYSRDRKRDFDNQKLKLEEWRRRLATAAFDDEVATKLREAAQP